MTTPHRQAAPPPIAPAKPVAPIAPRLEYFNSQHTESRSGKVARHLRLTIYFVAGIAGVVTVLLAGYLIRSSAAGRDMNWRWLGQGVRDCVVFGGFSSVLFAIALNRDIFSSLKIRRRTLALATSAGAGQVLMAAGCIRVNDSLEAPEVVVLLVTLLLVLVYPALAAIALGWHAQRCRVTRQVAD